MHRTTVIFEDSLAKKIKRLAAERGATFKETLTDLVTKGLKISTNEKPHELKWIVKDCGAHAVPVEDRDSLFSFMEENE